MSSNCGNDLQQEVAVCVQERDEGYRRCEREEQRRRRECENRERRTERECQNWETERSRECDGWGIFSFACVAWVWVTTRVCEAWNTVTTWVCVSWAEFTETVCVAWEWVSNVVCVAWEYIKVGICYSFDIISTILRIAIGILMDTIGFMLDILGIIILQIFSIPIIGRALEIIWNAATEFFWRVVSSFIEGPLQIFGIQPEKVMRICVIMPRQLAGQTDAAGQSNVDSAVDQIQEAKDIFRRETNVRLRPAIQNRELFNFETPFSDDEPVDEGWIRIVNVPDELLDVTCNFDAFLDTLGMEGSRFSNQSLQCVRGNFRKVIGYGPTVHIFFVRNHVNSLGCSLSGWLTDYATVNVGSSNNPPRFDTTAHELGHVCSLPHSNDPPLLMTTPNRTGTEITEVQEYVIRSSKFVTYF